MKPKHQKRRSMPVKGLMPPAAQRVNARKLALLRRADTERDSKGFSITGERKRMSFVKPAPITLARVACLAERADD